MRALVYYISLTIDGYIAGPDDEVDFFPGSEDYMAWMLSDYGDALPSHVREQFGIADVPHANFDTIVMGRRTYDPALTVGITSPYSHLRQYVVSRSLESPDPAVEVVSSDPLDLVRRLKAEDSPLDIYLAGGGSLAGQLLPEIDRLVVKRYPVVGGAGLRAFDTSFAPVRFDLTEELRFTGGNAVSFYVRSDTSPEGPATRD